MMPGPSSERAVILAASERDAVWTAHLIKEAGYYANICGDLAELVFVQRFRNTSHDFVDATYLFPLDDDAVVDAVQRAATELTRRVRGRR